MKSMRQQGNVGFVTVLSQGFCESCLPYPTNVISAVSVKLPVVAVKRNEGLLTIIKVSELYSWNLSAYKQNNMV